eukprot:9321365-Ditylum_brightwellii.AAC.1
MIDPGSWMGDIDVREMSLNFHLDINIRPCMGMEIEDEDEDENPIRKRGCWCRTFMCFSPSPYVCVRSYLRGKEVIQGNQTSKSNLLRWDQILLNLPGDEVYDPMKP